MADFDVRIAELMFHDAYAFTKRKLIADGIRPNENEKSKMVVILGGQPGSGKSSAFDKLDKTMKNNCIKIDADELRQYYPSYFQMVTHDPEFAGYVTQPYIGYVSDKLVSALSIEKYNLVIERTLGNFDSSIKEIKFLKEKDYECHVVVISVNEFESQIGCIHRAEEGIKQDGFGCSSFITTRNLDFIE